MTLWLKSGRGGRFSNLDLNWCKSFRSKLGCFCVQNPGQNFRSKPLFSFKAPFSFKTPFFSFKFFFAHEILCAGGFGRFAEFCQAVPFGQTKSRGSGEQCLLFGWGLGFWKHILKQKTGCVRESAWSLKGSIVENGPMGVSLPRIAFGFFSKVHRPQTPCQTLSLGHRHGCRIIAKHHCQHNRREAEKECFFAHSNPPWCRPATWAVRVHPDWLDIVSHTLYGTVCQRTCHRLLFVQDT